MFKKYFLLIFVLLLLSGCIEQQIVINPDNSSGNVIYKINFNKIFDSFISYQNKLENFSLKDNLLFNKEKLDESLKYTNKVKLINYSKITGEQNINYDIEFSFEDIDYINKNVKPILIENKMFRENKVVFCQTKLSLNNFGKIDKIKKEFANLKEDERNILETYLSLIKIKITYLTPYSINSDIKENIKYSVKVFDSYPSNFFEFEILAKLLKKEDKDVFNTLYRKDKLKNIYTFRQKISDENIKLIENILLSIGYKNIAVFEYTILDILKSKEFIDINLNYRIY